MYKDNKLIKTGIYKMLEAILEIKVYLRKDHCMDKM